MIEKIIQTLVDWGMVPHRQKTKAETIRTITNMLEAIKHEYDGKLPRWELKHFVQRFSRNSGFSERQIYRYINSLRALGFLDDYVELSTGKHYIVLSKRFGSRMLDLYRKYRAWLEE
ncbi:hypothetical protein A3L09_10665 (plasmid) [Thermococcus profundus]|uniref:Uncharacterized protein n=1 Tax=Thermococcus profundus TaxID=49899 RepID=A0A2Z2MGD8_THEPR|nr:hypothetical protein [Thermococcus profundus]ASJ03812.1 hypothetical protein A3L09_10665 [Thermococcus profundus]